MANYIVESLTADPASPVSGQMWLRSDLVPGWIAAPTNVAVSVGDTQNTITWNAVPGATSYNIKWGTATGVHGTTITGVTSGYIHTGLTNSTAYYYVVVALKTGATSSDSAQAVGTPGAALATFSYDFQSAIDLATDTNLRGVIVGSGTLVQDNAAPGTLKLTSTATGFAAFIYTVEPTNLTIPQTHTVKARFPGGTDHAALYGHWFDGTPAAVASAAFVRAFGIIPQWVSVTDTSLRFWYWNTSNVQQYWNGSAWVAGTAIMTQHITTDTKAVDNVYKIASNGTSLVFSVYAADGTTLIASNASSPLPIANIYNPGGKNLHIINGDYCNNAWTEGMWIDSISVE